MISTRNSAAILILSVITIMTANAEAQVLGNFQDIAVANNEFAFNLLRKMNDSQNAFFSPLSINAVFRMLFNGARGDTAEELRHVLGYKKANLSGDLIPDSYNLYINEVMQNGNSSDGYVLNVANAIFTNQNLKLHSKYINEIQDLYKATIRGLDFANGAHQSVKEINDWAKKETNGKIEKILDQLSPSTIMILINAVYFKGKWKIPFDSRRTSQHFFYNNGMTSQRKMVPMMSMTNRFFYESFQNFEALELPYKGDNIRMLILLPEKESGLQALEKNLTSEKLSDILKGLYKTKVHVFIPKFKFQFEKDLIQNIKALGINKIFQAGAAELSGMTSSTDVLIDKVVHNAVIEVNEEGSEAAAITRVHTSRSGPHEFIANCPFLFAIIERGSKSNMVLFLGRVNML